MKRARVTTLVGVVLIGAIAALFGTWSGLAPLSAREGHWAVTRGLLDYAMERTVRVRSSFIEPPPLGDSAQVMRGAGHFEAGCKPCHGAPGAPRPAYLRHMTPPPPSLPDRIHRWSPEELFWIVNNGIKFTGMPGWPAAERDDEVWAVVAFLRQLATMSSDEYRRLALGPAASNGRDERAPLTEPSGGTPPEVRSSCGRCHGLRGYGRLPGAFPKLAGQTQEYLLASLEAYAAGTRPSGIMEPVAAALSHEARQRLARYYSAIEPPGPGAVGDEAARARGERIALEGIPSLRVPSCADCHGPAPTPPRPAYPRLAGQDAAYLEQQLELFKSGVRGGSPYAHLMDPVGSRLPVPGLRDVAYYYARLEGDDRSRQARWGEPQRGPNGLARGPRATRRPTRFAE